MAKKKAAAKSRKKSKQTRRKSGKKRATTQHPAPSENGPANPAQRPCMTSQQRLTAAGESEPNAYFHKGLNHAENGAVSIEDWCQFVAALAELDESGDATPLASIPFEADNRKWVNPLSGWAVDTEMSDPCFHTIPAPPSLGSDEAAAEAIELYWMATLRDLPFPLWNGDANIQEAIEELSDQPLYINCDASVNEPPSAGGNEYRSIELSVNKLFRGGELYAPEPLREAAGPFVSQFLLQEVPYGTLRISQRNVWALPYRDYLTESADWLEVQNGEPRDPRLNLIGNRAEDASMRRHITSMRDLATYVHFDELFQAYLNASLILIQNSYPFGDGNPYGSYCPPDGNIGMVGPTSPQHKLSQNQQGFGTFGGAHVLTSVTEAATRALKAVWRQKWTHLRLRPEAYGGIVALRPHELPEGGERVKSSRAYQRNLLRYPSGLLPMAFPEGSPMHPAYGAGHATVAGACVTMLKAFFKEDEPVRDLKIASVDGLHLDTYEGTDASKLTVGLELDKLASNISIGRNMAGVHWRSDYTQSVLLGQRVAVDILFRQCRDYIEDYCFHFTSFGGGKVTIDKSGLQYAPPVGAESQVLSSSEFSFEERLPRSRDEEIATALLTIV